MSGIIGMKWGVRNYKPFDERNIENRLKESKDTKEGLALDMLLNAFGNEESINQACDLTKELEIVEDYQ